MREILMLATMPVWLPVVLIWRGTEDYSHAEKVGLLMCGPLVILGDILFIAMLLRWIFA